MTKEEHKKETQIVKIKSKGSNQRGQKSKGSVSLDFTLLFKFL